jgi:hypothetical protein
LITCMTAEIRYDATVLDRVAYGPGWLLEPGRSNELQTLFFDTVLNDDPANWCNAFTPFGDSEDLGTPGRPNGCGCDLPPVEGGPCPAECSGGCSGNNCVISCDGPNACEDQTMSCPEGFDCEIQCSGASACTFMIAACNSQGLCLLNCDYSSAPDVCAGATLLCGGNFCAQYCSEPPTFGEGPSPLSCGSACACADSCTAP